jgi:hypothetical protein
MKQIKRPTIHHTEIPPALAGEILFDESETYRHEVARLLMEGHEGKFVLIKGKQVVGLYDSWGAAREAGPLQYFPTPFLVQKVCAEEPVLRVRGYFTMDF